MRGFSVIRDVVVVVDLHNQPLAGNIDRCILHVIQPGVMERKVADIVTGWLSNVVVISIDLVLKVTESR